MAHNWDDGLDEFLFSQTTAGREEEEEYEELDEELEEEEEELEEEEEDKR